LLCSTAVAAHAVPSSFTSRSAFDTAVLAMNPVTQRTIDFDGAPAGSLIADGDTFAGISFNYPTLAGFGVSLKITGFADAPSGSNMLGTDDADLLLDGDDLSFGVGTVNAFGLFLVSIEPLINGDFELSAGGATASLVVADVEQELLDGGVVYFLGLVDPIATFDTVTLTTSHTPGDFFTWNLDDIVTARARTTPPTNVPEPSSVLLVALGMAGLRSASRGRRV